MGLKYDTLLNKFRQDADYKAGLANDKDLVKEIIKL